MPKKTAAVETPAVEAVEATEQQLTEHQQSILNHFGPNSVEFCEAMQAGE